MKLTYYLGLLILTISTYSFAKDSNSLFLNIQGYTKIYTYPKVYIKENNAWKQINTILPAGGFYYLDGKYVPGNTVADYFPNEASMCFKISKPYEVQMQEYKNLGTKSSEGGNVPDFQTIPLKGEIKIEFEYFDDALCQIKKTFSTAVIR